MRHMGRRTRRSPLRSRIIGRIAAVSLAGGLTACGSVAPVAPAEPPITDPTQLYMRLALDHPAVTMSTAPGYNTLSLTATPLDAQGHLFNGLPAPTYRSSDTARVEVTADGVITAKMTGTGIRVIAELADGPVRHADTALIDVTAEAAPPMLTTFAIARDSAVWPIVFADGYEYNGTTYYPWGYFLGAFSGMTQEIPAIVTTELDANGSAMNLQQVEYRSLDPAVATIDRRFGQVTLHTQGRVRMVAQTTAYGISKADTLTYTVSIPSLRTVSIQPDSAGTPIFGWSEVVIPPYGVVVWANYLQDVADVTFDGPVDMIQPPAALCDFLSSWGVGLGIVQPSSSCGTGNALLGPQLPTDEYFPYVELQVRQFPTPGTYQYHSARTGATGRIVVTGTD